MIENARNSTQVYFSAIYAGRRTQPAAATIYPALLGLDGDAANCAKKQGKEKKPGFHLVSRVSQQ